MADEEVETTAVETEVAEMSVLDALKEVRCFSILDGYDCCDDPWRGISHNTKHDILVWSEKNEERKHGGCDFAVTDMSTQNILSLSPRPLFFLLQPFPGCIIYEYPFLWCWLAKTS